jgi:hypothetical protein
LIYLNCDRTSFAGVKVALLIRFQPGTRFTVLATGTDVVE